MRGGRGVRHHADGLEGLGGQGDEPLELVLAWILTIPAAAAIGGLTYGLTRLFGTGAVGPAVVSVLIVGLVAAGFGRRLQRGSPISAEA